ncbi:MAG TPA: 4-hydroxy-tetrahydrodipicolinate synthase [Dehalococcoidia bacterium]|nr:4-hydroxy-tetrahydrodipicolinate synthase [Dehalococcoidia bacterium]
MEIGRLLTAMVTPFDREGKVDYEQAKRLALALLDSGSEGLVVAGTTGEAPTLTHEEKTRLFAEIKGAVGNRGSVMAGTGTYDTAESIDLTRAAEQAGADAVLLTTPYYSKPPQEGLFRHFAAVAGSTSLPCVVYNIPGRTGVNVTLETQLRIAEIPNVIGVKEASGDLAQIAAIVAQASKTYRVWSGDDALTLPILAVGGYGAIAVASHLIGAQIQKMIQAHLAGQHEEAGAIHRKTLPLMNILMTAWGNPGGVKFALRQAGFNAGGFRLPLCEPDEAAAEKITAELRRQHIDLAVAV